MAFFCKNRSTKLAFKKKLFFIVIWILKVNVLFRKGQLVLVLKLSHACIEFKHIVIELLQI